MYDSLLHPVELQFEVTLWCLGSCAPLSPRYSRLLSLARVARVAIVPFHEMLLESTICHYVIEFF